MKIGKRRNEYTDSQGTSSHEREIGDQNFEFWHVTNPDDPDGTRTEVWQDVKGGTAQRHNVKHGGPRPHPDDE